MKKYDKTINNLNLNDYDYLLKDEMWDLLSAYIDDELSVEESYLVIKQLNTNIEYQKAYKELGKLKKILGSLTKIKVSDSFDETLYRKINELKNKIIDEESFNNEEEEQWELISAYVDDELSAEKAYEVLKKIEAVPKYKKMYEEMLKIKNTLHSIGKRQVSEDFETKLFDKINKMKTNEKNKEKVIQFQTIKDKKDASKRDIGKVIRRVGMSLSAAAVIVLVFVFAIRFGLNNYPSDEDFIMSDNSTESDLESNDIDDSFEPETEKTSEVVATSLETDGDTANSKKEIRYGIAKETEETNDEIAKTVVKADSLDEPGKVIETTKQLILGPDAAKAVFNMGNRLDVKNKARNIKNSAEFSDKSEEIEKKFSKNERNPEINERSVSAVLLRNVLENFDFEANELLEIHKSNKELFNSEIIKEQSTDIAKQIRIMSRTVTKSDME